MNDWMSQNNLVLSHSALVDPHLYRLEKGLSIVDLTRDFGEDLLQGHGSHVEFEERAFGSIQRQFLHFSRDRNQLQQRLVHVDARLQVRFTQHAHDEVERDRRVHLDR